MRAWMVRACVRADLLMLMGCVDGRMLMGWDGWKDGMC